MSFKGNPLLQKYKASLTAASQNLSAEEIIALSASLTETGALLGKVMLSKIPSMPISSALDAFANCGNSTISNKLFPFRLREFPSSETWRSSL